MSEKNEVVVRQMIEDVWNRKRLQTIENFCAPDYINHDPQAPTTGLAAFRESVQKY